MKVSLIGINSAYSHMNLAVLYLKNNSIPKNIHSEVKQYNINMNINDVIEDLYFTNSDVYIFSCYIWNIEYVLKVASSIKKITNKKIIFGGSEVSFNAKEYFEKYDFIDYIVAGEGEEITYSLLDKLSSNSEENINIENVFTKNSKDYTYIKNHIDFNSVVFPYKNIDMKEFDNKIVYYESARGCPYNCSYCLSELDKSLRYRNVEKVKKELMFFINNNIPLVKFIDRTFNANLDRAKEILNFIIENSKHTKFHFEICANLLDEEMIDILNNAPNDMFQLEIGLQSINEDTIKEINRVTDIDKLAVNVKKLLKNNNVHIHLDLISGLPYEDMNSFIKSFNFAYGLKPHMLQLGFLKVLHGTIMEENQDKYQLKYNRFTPYEIVSNKWIDYKDICTLKEIEFLIDKYYNSGAFYNTINYFDSKNKDYYSFYSDLKEYFKENNLFNFTISKQDLYSKLYNFLSLKDETISSNLISFDYLKYMKIRKNQKDFMENIEVLNKEEVFEIIKEKAFKEKYLKEYLSLNTKETYKHISIYKFSINPETMEEKETYILFKDVKNDDVFSGYEHFIINL